MVDFLEAEGGKLSRVPREKFLEQRGEPTTKSSHLDTEAGFQTQAMLVGGAECSHHCTISAPIYLIVKKKSVK